MTKKMLEAGVDRQSVIKFTGPNVAELSQLFES